MATVLIWFLTSFRKSCFWFSRSSSLSAFIRVARQDNDENDLYLNLNVDNLALGTEPIDALQNLFDDWNGEQQNMTAGDADGNQLVNVADILIVIGQIIGTQTLDEDHLYVVDMNFDSTLNIQDIILIINLILL